MAASIRNSVRQAPSPSSGANQSEASTDDLKVAIRSLCLVTSERQSIVSPSGKRQRWLIDLRKALLDPKILNELCRRILSGIDSASSWQIAAVETAAIPLLTGVLLAGTRDHSLSGIIIRKERKRSGLGQAIEGTVSGAPTILLDDVLNSGASAEKARVVLEHQGIPLQRVVVVIDFEAADGLEWRRKHGIQVEALFKLSDFSMTLHSRRNTTSKQHTYNPIWQFNAGQASAFHVVPKSAPLVVGDNLYFGTDRGSVYCLDWETGQSRWTFQCKGTGRKGIWSSVGHHEHRLYFGAYNGSLYCLNAATGKMIWCQECCDWVGSTPYICPENGQLYIGLEYERPRAKGSMAAFSLATGEKIWEHWLKEYQHGSGAYWREGDLVVFGTSDHDVRALCAKTGALVWKFETRGAVKYMPRIDDERRIVVLASLDGSIYVLDVSDGKKIAEFATSAGCYTQPLITRGRIFCGSGDRHLHVVELSKMAQVKTIDCGARVYSSPRLIAGNVVFGTNGGIVREVDPTTLEVKGKLVVADAVTNAVAATNDGRRIFVPTYMNEIFAFERIC